MFRILQNVEQEKNAIKKQKSNVVVVKPYSVPPKIPMTKTNPLIIPRPFPGTKANNQNPHPVTKTTNKRVPTKRLEVKVVPVEQKVQEVERNCCQYLLFELVGYDSVILMLAKRVFHWKKDHRVQGPDITKLVVKIGV